jgi:hypothetical protein
LCKAFIAWKPGQRPYGWWRARGYSFGDWRELASRETEVLEELGELTPPERKAMEKWRNPKRLNPE